MFLSTALLFSLFACSRDTEYNDSVPCSEILDTLEEQLPIDLGYETYGGDYVEYHFGNLGECDDRSIRYSVLSENIDEFGIFHAKDKKSKDLISNSVENYIQSMVKDKKEFIASYAPKELPKLESAEVSVYGNYVAYAILSDKDRSTFFETVENLLNK